MFPTLKAKLILAFVAVVALTVTLSGIGAFVLLRDQQIRAEEDRVGALMLRTMLEVDAYAQRNATPQNIAVVLNERAADWNVRFLLVTGDGQVVADTAGELEGSPYDPQAETNLRTQNSRVSGFGFRRWEGEKRYYWEANRLQSVTEPVLRQYSLRMVVPQSRIASAWQPLVPRLGGAALIALVVAGVIAYLLARSIARPVARVTLASERMARGDYNQSIPVLGRDEIGRLGIAFNAMAAQVRASHQMMRDLLANVAHELKTPLTSIQGFSQALTEGAARTEEDRTRAAEVINEEGERMRRLVDDLLYLSQLETGQLRMELGSVEIGEVLHAAVERMARRARARDVALRLLVAPELRQIEGDERRLEQVLANLLDNAVRHTPAGGAVTLCGERKGDELIVAVHNDGSYIPPEVLGRVFERFYRADPARVRQSGNTGLGLSIAQQIAQAHGGRIEASSDPEGGTEFRLVLPLPPESGGEPAGRHGVAGRLGLPVRRSA